jgi:hypothetical protein
MTSGSRASPQSAVGVVADGGLCATRRDREAAGDQSGPLPDQDQLPSLRGAAALDLERVEVDARVHLASETVQTAPDRRMMSGRMQFVRQ